MTQWIPAELRAWADRRFSADTRTPSAALRRAPRFEPLETRTVLSANGLGLDEPARDMASEAAQVAVQQVEDSITIRSIQLQVNHERIVNLTASDSTAFLAAGDHVQLVGVAYDVTAGPDGMEGIIAAESCIHKVPEAVDGGAGAFDFADGRYGGATTTEPIVAGEGFHGGVNDGWTVEEGWDRISVALIRYFGNSSEVEASFHAKLQIGEPDFVITKSLAKQVKKMKKLTVGETVELKGGWANNGTGRFHNYMEVDIYHMSNPDYPEWVGVLVGNANAEGKVEGAIENHNDSDSFSVHWTPQQAGEYMLLVAVDPEDAWSETDETDNRQKLYVTVHEAKETKKDAAKKDKERHQPADVDFESEKVSKREALAQKREQRLLRERAQKEKRQLRREERKEQREVAREESALARRKERETRQAKRKLRERRAEEELGAVDSAFSDSDLVDESLRGKRTRGGRRG